MTAQSTLSTGTRKLDGFYDRANRSTGRIVSYTAAPIEPGFIRTTSRSFVSDPYRDDIKRNVEWNLAHGVRFRLLDDDGEVYFEGRMTLGTECFGFEPLDSVGAAYGCTEIQVWTPGKGGGWTTL